MTTLPTVFPQREVSMTRLKPLASVLTFCCLLLLLATAARAETLSATMYLATDKGPGAEIGAVTFADGADGLLVTTNLKGLPPGKHGFHVHEKPDCGAVEKDGKIGHALAAGGHYDPDKTGKHLGPEGGGHKGDLPVLTVAADGTDKETLKIKGIKAAEFKNRALMIHAGGDNYSDAPAPLGGGGARIACGIIK